MHTELRTQTATLVLGFRGEILNQLRQTMDVRYVISEDDTADIKWSQLQFLNLEPGFPRYSDGRTECLAYAKTFFYIYADIFSRRYRYVSDSISEIQNAFVLTFDICFRILKEHNIRLLVFSNIPHEGYDYIFYLIAKFLKLKIVMCNQSIFPNRFFLCASIDDLGKFKQNPKLFELESTNYVLPEKWFFMRGVGQDHSYQTFQMLREILQNPRGIRVALWRHYNAVNYRRNLAAAKVAPVAGERFIYFPLHLQPELSTSVMGGEYADQLSSIERLSAFLPEGVWIYAKENPLQTEMQRGPMFFKRLNRLPNVRLIDRNASSVDLIKQSMGVAAITGTAGWEAIFYGKPVLVFGYAWYAEFGGVTAYRPDLTFDEFLQNSPPSSETTILSLDEFMTKTGTGVVDPDYAHLVSSYTEDSNAIAVCESIARFIAGGGATG